MRGCGGAARSLLTAGRVNKGRRPPAHGAGTARGAAPRPSGHRERGGSPAHRPLSRSPSRSPRCRRCLGGTRRRVSRRAEGAAPPLTETRPLLPSLPPARPPSPRAGAASPLCRRLLARSPLRPAAVPPAPPRGTWPAQPSPPPARCGCCGCCIARPSLRGSRNGDRQAGGEDGRGAEPPAARAARCVCVSGDGLGFVLRLSLPAERRAVIVRPARPGRRGVPVKCHDSPSAPRRHPAHRSPREGAVKVAAEAAPAAARPAAARREGAPRQPPGKRRAPCRCRREPAREGTISFAGGPLAGRGSPRRGGLRLLAWGLRGSRVGGTRRGRALPGLSPAPRGLLRTAVVREG